MSNIKIIPEDQLTFTERDITYMRGLPEGCKWVRIHFERGQDLLVKIRYKRQTYNMIISFEAFLSFFMQIAEADVKRLPYRVMTDRYIKPRVMDLVNEYIKQLKK